MKKILLVVFLSLIRLFPAHGQTMRELTDFLNSQDSPAQSSQSSQVSQSPTPAPAATDSRYSIFGKADSPEAGRTGVADQVSVVPQPSAQPVQSAQPVVLPRPDAQSRPHSVSPPPPAPPAPPKPVSSTPPKFELVGEPVLVGPAFLRGWAIKPLAGYRYKEGGARVPIGGGTYKLQVDSYVLVPQSDKDHCVVNLDVLPLVNSLIERQANVLADLRRQLDAIKQAQAQGR